MTQAIICRSNHGLVLAGDSAVLREAKNGQVERQVEQRLYTLGSHAAILSAGAAAGVELSARLAQWLESRGQLDFDDVLVLGRDLLAEGYARYLRAHQGQPEGHTTANRHLYFVIGGYAPAHAREPYQAVLLQSEAGQLPFHETPLGHVFTLPRRLALEGRLARQIAEGDSLRSLARNCHNSLASLTRRNPEALAEPLLVAMLTAAGIEMLGDEGLPEEPEEEA